MGILNLNPFLGNFCPESTETLSIEKLKGKRVVIDASTMIHAEKSIATKIVVGETNLVKTGGQINQKKVQDLLKEQMLNKIITILSKGVLPVLVYDGKPPPEKFSELKKRGDTKREKLDRIAVLQKKLAKADPLDIPHTVVSELRQLLINYNRVTSDDYKAVKHIFNLLGLPQLQAKGEAEQLCSMLARELLISAVISKDGDNLPLGCPLWLSPVNKGQYRAVNLKKALKIMDVSMPTFLDMCIMLGCDYNKRISGIGVMTVWKLLKEHRRINKLPKKYNTKCLKYKRCRELFAPVSSESLIDSGSIHINRSAPIKNQVELEKLGYNMMIFRFTSLYSSLPKIQHAQNISWVVMDE